MVSPGQYGIPCAYIQGGTSKALLFHKKDIPSTGPLRDAVLTSIMESFDAHSSDNIIDGTIHTSKAAIIHPSAHEDADVDFTFAQVCLFTIGEGLVSVIRMGYGIDSSMTTREVRIYNTNTQKILVLQVPVDPKSGLSQLALAAMDSVPGRTSIIIDYRNAVGASCARGLFPSGRKVDHVSLDNKEVEFTTCDVGGISCIVRAADMGVSGSELASQISGDSDLVA